MGEPDDDATKFVTVRADDVQTMIDVAGLATGPDAGAIAHQYADARTRLEAELNTGDVTLELSFTREQFDWMAEGGDRAGRGDTETIDDLLRRLVYERMDLRHSGRVRVVLDLTPQDADLAESVTPHNDPAAGLLELLADYRAGQAETPER